MFRFLLTDRRMTSLAAITVLTLGTLSSPAVAQIRNPNPGLVLSPRPVVNTSPVRVFFTELRCLDESSEDHDEPYVVVFTADLRGSTASGRVFVSREFSDVDTGETRNDLMSIWGLNGNGAPINSQEDYIFLVALMESDSARIGGNRDAIQKKLTSVLIPKLSSYNAAGMSYGQMVSNLRTDMNLAIEVARDDSGDADDRIGGVQHLVFVDFQLESARNGFEANSITLKTFTGNNSNYTLNFRVQR